mmetsp:Transcript_48694/g.156443  ORF Transcript_48694/g.156443 Transcript_48694/m.156443 type:complete len:224 (+) Transcript_48694:2660-3331(+)
MLFACSPADGGRRSSVQLGSPSQSESALKSSARCGTSAAPVGGCLPRRFAPVTLSPSRSPRSSSPVSPSRLAVARRRWRRTVSEAWAPERPQVSETRRASTMACATSSLALRNFFLQRSTKRSSAGSRRRSNTTALPATEGSAPMPESRKPSSRTWLKSMRFSSKYSLDSRAAPPPSPWPPPEEKPEGISMKSGDRSEGRRIVAMGSGRGGERQAFRVLAPAS